MSTKQLKILAIDDTEDNLVVLDALLSDSFPGSKILFELSAIKGIERAKTELPDVILLDVVMPEMDGFVACSIIKSDPDIKHIPVIMLTAARTDKETKIKALDLGADAFLSKPIDESELIAQTKAMLRIKESEDMIRTEKDRLSMLVKERTSELEMELAERRRIEKDLKQSLETLEKSKEEILRKNNDLLKLNTELDRFVYSTSHDLRSPLTSILGILNFIDRESKEEKTLAHIHLIRTAIRRLDEFVKNLLDYSRNNRLDVVAEPVNFQDIIQQTIAGFKGLEHASQIQFKIDTESGEPFYSDSKRISTIFENLIGNSIKYSKQDITDPSISIKVEHKYNVAKIRISDNGIGIADEHQSKIFDMFYRISGNLPGSGLGLYLVKEIVEKLSGSIQIESRLHVGTSFTIVLANLNQ